ncbi:MAG TPA: LacI family transcriptional regulator [Lachnospiraceae bacterium]|nr:LacI family transcriptional regulator [Lachnospiraceae bacterium]
MISLKDVAIRCNVSIATVSKALNGHSDISPATRELVMNTARELGYHPNSSARALKTNRTYNLGVLFMDESLNGLTHDYFSHVLDGFRVYSESKGYDITFINTGSKDMSYLRHSQYRGFDGVVIACVDFRDPQVTELLESDIPIVTIDHADKCRCSVLSDNKGGMSELVSFIHTMGHERICYICGDDTSVTQDRLNGYYETLSRYDISPDGENVLRSHYRNPEDTYRLTKSLLHQKNRPTCIIYPDDYSCIGGINAINEAGLRIPDDISIAGYDGLFLAKVLSPKLTTYEQASDTIGKTAAEKLIQLIDNPRNPVSECVIVPGRVIKGESVKEL